MSKIVNRHRQQNPFLDRTADALAVLPLMPSCVRNQKHCHKIGFHLSLSITIFVADCIKKRNELNLLLDLNPCLPHIAPQISKQHD